MGINFGEKKIKETFWTIRDTEFLIRLIGNCNIPGSDIEIAASVVKKIKSVHKKLLNMEA